MTKKGKVRCVHTYLDIFEHLQGHTWQFCAYLVICLSYNIHFDITVTFSRAIDQTIFIQVNDQQVTPGLSIAEMA